MAVKVVVKIDLCKSRLFSHEREAENPEIRKVLAETLREISQEGFPYSDKRFPDGSFYKAEGDAVYYILEKPTVAIRSAIEFMKEWYYRGIKKSFPESKIIIHRGKIDSMAVPGGTDFVGKVFEDISVIEKTLDEGKIYVTDDVRKNSDLTISKFVNYGRRRISKSERIEIYCVAFCDPRTFENDSLAHLLFVAYKGSTETRKKILRFFLIEYLMENERISKKDLNDFISWSTKKGYPQLPKGEITEFLKDKALFDIEIINGAVTYRLKKEQIDEMRTVQERYEAAVMQAIKIVGEEIKRATNTDISIEGFDIKRILEEYLCGVFSEIRMMANYFRDTHHFYESDLKIFERYDYVLDRYLFDIDELVAKKWKEGFISGL